MKLIFNSLIDDVDPNLSPSNIGARRNRSPLDHLLVVYSVINETINNKEAKNIDLVFDDVKECFDS